MKNFKKIIFTLCLALFAGFGMAQEPNPDAFITVWEPTGTSIKFPGVGTDYTILVRDLSSNTVVKTIPNASSTAGNPYEITGLKAGVRYAIEVVPNSTRARDFNGFLAIQDDPDNEKLNLKEIKQWGTIEWNRTNGLVKAFLNCRNLELTATDKPIFVMSPVNLTALFQGCKSLTGVGSSISDWDMSNVTRISQMFSGAVLFNQPLNWDVSKVISMIRVFDGASSFNQDLGSWNIKSLMPNGGTRMFNKSGMGPDNIAATLTGWANNPDTPNNVKLGTAGVPYNKTATKAKAKLVNKGWTITD